MFSMGGNGGGTLFSSLSPPSSAMGINFLPPARSAISVKISPNERGFGVDVFSTAFGFGAGVSLGLINFFIIDLTVSVLLDFFGAGGDSVDTSNIFFSTL